MSPPQALITLACGLVRLYINGVHQSNRNGYLHGYSVGGCETTTNSLATQPSKDPVGTAEQPPAVVARVRPQADRDGVWTV